MMVKFPLKSILSNLHGLDYHEEVFLLHEEQTNTNCQHIRRQHIY